VAAEATGTRFRPDIEGLRAIAIGLVVLTHSGFRFARGGYVGVDVFFVISGFLITGLLAGELDRSGRICLRRFYARRIKRLLPQAVLAIVCVAIASHFVLGPVRAEAVAHDVSAAGGYAMNIRLSAQAADYFAQQDAHGPLDHFWSLAVEEQFYMLWPLVLLGLGVVGRHHRPFLVGGLAAIATASLLYAEHATRVAPASAYFDTLGRAWELALGGLLVLALGSRRLPSSVAAGTAWLGVAAIAAATARFDSGTAFPGLPALLPTLGAAALIAAGTSRAPAVPTRLLASAPAQYLGRRSYAWYVWHWPVLVVAAAAIGPLSTTTAILVLAASLVPTIVTHRLVEEPMRRSTLHVRMPRTILALAPAGALTALCAAVLLVAALPSMPSLAKDRVKGAAALAISTALQPSARAVVPTPRHADTDRGSPVDDGCLIDGNSTWASRCMYGDLASQRTVVLFGDSHAFQYFSPIERLARRRHWRLVELTKQGCPPADVTVWATFLGRAYPECGAWQRKQLQQMAGARPAMIVVSGSAHYGVMDAAGGRLQDAAGLEALGSGYARMLTRLQALTAHVVFLTDSPRPPQYIPDCVAESLGHLRRCAFQRGPAVADAKRVRSAVAGVPGVQVLDATPEYCPRRLCPAVIGNVLVYRNSGHITDTYTRTLTPWLAARIPNPKG
jgi:peptidoglycan/LPS O-acetylase OafA/YrhL